MCKIFVPAGIAAAKLCDFLFVFYDGPCTGSINLETVGDHSCRPQCTPRIKQLNFSDNVVTFLCSLGALPASLVALRVSPTLSFMVYSIVLNTETYQNCKGSFFFFTGIRNLLERRTLMWR